MKRSPASTVIAYGPDMFARKGAGMITLSRRDDPQIICERRGSVFARRSALIAGAAGCGTSSIAHQTTSAAASAEATTSPAQPPVAAPGQSVCTDLNGTVGPGHTCRVHSATSTHQIDMRFPLDYPDCNR
jgi:hypothetical protein